MHVRHGVVVGGIVGSAAQRVAPAAAAPYDAVSTERMDLGIVDGLRRWVVDT
jgi:hypothetical protein